MSNVRLVTLVSKELDYAYVDARKLEAVNLHHAQISDAIPESETQALAVEGAGAAFAMVQVVIEGTLIDPLKS